MLLQTTIILCTYLLFGWVLRVGSFNNIPYILFYEIEAYHEIYN